MTTAPGRRPRAPRPGWPGSFVEELGALGPEVGIPRAMMRVMAWMMVCEPPEQTAQQIQSGLQLSAGAVSGATRQLIAAGMLERASRPGDATSITASPPAAGTRPSKPNCVPLAACVRWRIGAWSLPVVAPTTA
jgi:hypothetical protein